MFPILAVRDGLRAAQYMIRNQVASGSTKETLLPQARIFPKGIAPMKVYPPVILSLGMVVASLSAVGPSVSLAGEKISVGRNVPENQLVSIDQIDHRIWDGLLRRYVDNDGNVAYTQWKKSVRDTQALDSYLATLSAANPTARASKEAALALLDQCL